MSYVHIASPLDGPLNIDHPSTIFITKDNGEKWSGGWGEG